MDPKTVAYFRRYSFPFVASSVPLNEAEESRPSHIQNIKIYNYVLKTEELENERPFMSGRKEDQLEGGAFELPIPTPVHVRDILSDEEIENERPFMRGRIKVDKELLRATLDAKSKVYNVLSDEEWENEKPFMHGRNRIPKGQRRYLQIAPVLIPLERENERPFMAGRNKLPKKAVERKHQRQLVDLSGQNDKDLGIDHSAEGITLKGVKPNKKIRKRHLCPPCQALNHFRKEKLVPAVKNMLAGRNTSSSEKLIPKDDVDKMNPSSPILSNNSSAGRTDKKTRRLEVDSLLLNTKAAAKIYKENPFRNQVTLAKYNKYMD